MAAKCKDAYDSRNEALLAAARDGDASAAEKLVTENLSLAMSIARRFHMKAPGLADIDDLKGEASLALWRAVLALCENRASFRAFATTCVVNAVKDRLNYHVKRRGLAGSGLAVGCSADRLSPLAADAPGVGSELEGREAAAVAMSCLDGRRAEVVRLRFGIGSAEHTLEEAGRALGVVKQTVAGHERKAIEMMRRRLGAADV